MEPESDARWAIVVQLARFKNARAAEYEDLVLRDSDGAIESIGPVKEQLS